MLRASQNTYLYINSIYSLEQVWFQYLGGASVGYDTALE
jgi:hypothetical protein